MNIILLITISIILILIIISIYCLSSEKWSNTYSAVPGPLEGGCESCYNIPALHPRYNADKHYKHTMSTNGYMTMSGYP